MRFYFKALLPEIVQTAIYAALIAAFAACAPAGGYAADEKATPPGLTVEQALNVASGLAKLTSYDTVDKDGKPSKVYYKLSADLRILIAVNIDVGRAIQTRFQNASNDLIMQMSDGVGTLPDEKKGVFNVELAKLMQAQSRAGYTRFKMSDLKLDENQIPVDVLSLIIPILDR